MQLAPVRREGMPHLTEGPVPSFALWLHAALDFAPLDSRRLVKSLLLNCFVKSVRFLSSPLVEVGRFRSDFLSSF